MQHQAALLVIALVAATCITRAHEHDKQHSHLCIGGGYNLFCEEGKTLRIDKAWYGRIAHDHASCVDPANGTEGGAQDLAQDCGSSILASKASWCQNPEKGGCTIAVKGLEPATEEKKCPDTVVKYLYLEYECVGKGSNSAVSLQVHAIVFLLLGIFSLSWCH